MNRNITIAYFLVFFRHAYLWLGIWVFYYLQFTDYAGIGLIETAMIIAMMALEIPSGAIADFFGKKKTLIVSFFLQTIGMLIMTFTLGFNGLIIGVMLAGIGASFYSGTLEALVYDSFKQQGKEKNYGKTIANINTISMFSPALFSVIGGFLYVVQPNLPFLIHGVLYFIAFVSCFFLIEPKIDTVKFSLHNFFKQTKIGMQQLFHHTVIIRQTLVLLAIGGIVVVTDEMLNSFLGVEFGFKPEGIGILWAGISLVAGFASQLTPHFKKYSSEITTMVFVGLSIALSLIVSPYVGLFFGGISLLVRTSLQVMYSNVASVMINDTTESKYRATTLSSFSLLKNTPYVLTAYYLGSLADRYSAMSIVYWLGILLLVAIGIFLVSSAVGKRGFRK